MKEDWILVVVKAFEDDAGVLAAETERVGHRDLDLVATWFIRHVVQIALRVRVLQVDGRVNDPVVDAEDRGNRLDRSGGTEQLAGHGLGAGDGGARRLTARGLA